MSPHLELQTMWAELEAAYDTRFIRELLNLPGARLFVFGGATRDILNNRPWKDLDLRIVLPGPKEQRNAQVEEIFQKHGKIVMKLSFSNGECFVMRARFPGEKQIVADIQVVDSLEATPGDFTVSSLFMDLATGELYQQTPNGFEDLHNKIIRPVAGTRVFEDEASYILLRALKLACQTGFELEQEFEQLIKNNPHKVREHIEQDLAYIAQNGKDSFAETRLGNIFSGLKVDPQRYVSLINGLGLYPHLCQGFASIVPAPKSVPHPSAFEVEKYQSDLSLEKKISHFISDICRSISHEPEKCFEAIKKALALDSERADGNEFVIDPAKVVFTK